MVLFCGNAWSEYTRWDVNAFQPVLLALFIWTFSLNRRRTQSIAASWLKLQTADIMGGSTPETLAVYSGLFFDDVVLLLDVSS